MTPSDSRSKVEFAKSVAWNIFQVLALVAAIIAFINDFDIDFMCDRRCRDFEIPWIASLFASGGLLIAGAGVASIWVGENWKRYVTWAQICAVAIALTTMLVSGHYCILCLSIQSLWVASAVLRFKGLWLVPIAGAFTYYACWILIGITQDAITRKEPQEFVARNFEPDLHGTNDLLVLFTDPMCSACINRNPILYSGEPDPVILYRWKIISSSGSNGVVAAALFESCLERNLEKGREMIKLYYAKMKESAEKPDTLDWRNTVIESGVQAGFEEDYLQHTLQQPDQWSLAKVEADGALARDLGIDEVPTLGMVSSRLYGDVTIRFGELHPDYLEVLEDSDLEGTVDEIRLFYGKEK